MLQVVQRNSFGRIKSFRMHDLVRELAIFQSTEESFSTTYDENHGVTPMGLDSRRLSLLQCSKGIPSNINPSRLRTFITFDTSMTLVSSWYSSVSSKSTYLAVLDLSGLPIEGVPNSIGELFNLRLLSLDNTEVKELPRFIVKLQNLQTLSLERTKLLNFPRGFSKLKKLRYLSVSRFQDETSSIFKSWEAVAPFKGLWNLNELHTLFAIKASEIFVAKLGNLSQLRTLEICDVRSSHCAQLCNSLSKIHQLSRLLIRACTEYEVLQLDDLTFPNPLHCLTLQGRLSDNTLTSPFFINHGHALLQIDLQYYLLAENPVPRLSGLSNLTSLHLQRAYMGEQLHFQSNWFQNLKEITLRDLTRVNLIRIDEGALVNLEHLYTVSLQELQEVPIGFSFLTSLKEAYFIDMHPDFTSNFRKEAVHIPNVYM